MGNISLFCGIEDSFVKYGLCHFMTKFGFVNSLHPAEADVLLGSSRGLNFPGVSLSLNNPAEDIPSYLNISGESIPYLADLQRPSGTAIWPVWITGPEIIPVYPLATGKLASASMCSRRSARSWLEAMIAIF
jgi:hypothetical protein